MANKSLKRRIDKLANFLMSRLTVDHKDEDRLRLESLEPRVMYDASPIAAAIDSMSVDDVEILDVGTLSQEELVASENIEESFVSVIDELMQISSDDAFVISAPVTEIVFIDEGVDGYEQLVEDIVGSGENGHLLEYQVVVLNRDSDGIEQISKFLNGEKTYDAVHIVSHGNEGSLLLGGSEVNSGNIVDFQSALQNWSIGLSEDADILLYGCEVAASEDGKWLVEQISTFTGADIAASDDMTGHSSYDADWEFEYYAGAIETEVLFSLELQSSWTDALGYITVTTTNDVVDGDADLSSLSALQANSGSDGLVSLREAVIAANANLDADTITLGVGTFNLNIAGANEDVAASGDLDVLNNLTIRGQGAAFTIIDANGLDRVFDLRSGSVTLNDMQLRGGDVAVAGQGGGINIRNGATLNGDGLDVRANSAFDGGGIFNSGVLNLSSSLVYQNSVLGQGGGIRNEGVMTLANVTVSDNSAPASSAGVSVDGGSTLLTNVTIADNTGYGQWQ